MSCSRFESVVGPGGRVFDDLSPDERSRFVDHLRGCSRCREAALAADSSMLFESLPRVELLADELNSIRSSVRTLRRAREVERSVSMVRWTRRAAAVAALFVVALLLDPGRPEQVSDDVPFAGALGVGAGQLDLGPSDEDDQPPAPRLTETAGDADHPSHGGEGQDSSGLNDAEPDDGSDEDSSAEHKPLQ